MSSLYELHKKFGVSQVSSRVSAAQSNVQLVAAPGAKKQHWIVGLDVHTAVAGEISIRDTSNAILQALNFDLSANGGVIRGCHETLVPCGVNNAIKWNTDITGDHHITVYYITEDNTQL